ncbi:MAG TPA: hypothetical protein VGU65_07285 [Frateuria sp.]|uniref:hypothetical protein n=1 Tax=Frateuria sp. TaxID=2211372 RepID=UPI002DF64165|nr:hypothetical protein [Frateuria sp.]
MAYLVGDIVVVGSWVVPPQGRGFVGQFALLRAQPGLPVIRTGTVDAGGPFDDLFEAAEAGCQAGIEAAKVRQGDIALMPIPYPPGPLSV